MYYQHNVLCQLTGQQKNWSHMWILSGPRMEPWVPQKVVLAMCFSLYQSLLVVSSLRDNCKLVLLSLSSQNYKACNLVINKSWMRHSVSQSVIPRIYPLYGLLQNRGSLFQKKIKVLWRKDIAPIIFNIDWIFRKKILKVSYCQENNFFQPKLARKDKKR